MTRQYMDAPLGSLDHVRIARQALDRMFLLMLDRRFHIEGHDDVEGLARVARESYLPDLPEGPVRSFYDLMVSLASDIDHAWGIIPRLAGSDELWRDQEKYDTPTMRYTRPALAAITRTPVPTKEVAGYVSWGADDEDRLGVKGAMPLYFVVGDKLDDAQSARSRFLGRVTGFGYDITSDLKQSLAVSASGFRAGSTTVFRMDYQGPRKKGKKLVGGYVGG